MAEDTTSLMGPTAHGKYLIFIYIAGCMTITCGQLLNILCFCRNCCCCSSSATRVGLTILWLKPVKLEPWQWWLHGAKIQNAPKKKMCGTANLTCLAQRPLLEISYSASLSCWLVGQQARFFKSSSIWVWPAFPCQPSSTINVYVYMTFANYDYDNYFFCIFQLLFWHPLGGVQGEGGGVGECVKSGHPLFSFKFRWGSFQPYISTGRSTRRKW